MNNFRITKNGYGNYWIQRKVPNWLWYHWEDESFEWTKDSATRELKRLQQLDDHNHRLNIRKVVNGGESDNV